MSKSALRDVIRGLIAADPHIRPSLAGHTGYIERYRSVTGANIGLETRGERHQNLYVEAHRVDLARVGDIPHQPYRIADAAKPNSNLFHAEAFDEVDIIRFKLEGPEQAERVLAELKR